MFVTRRWPFRIAILFLLFGLPWTLSAQQNPQEPLSNAELRAILLRLNQLPISWEVERLLRANIAQQEQLLERERALALRELDTEKQRTALVESQLKLEVERGDFYRDAVNRLTEGPGFWCRLARVFTFGLKACR